MHFPFAEAPVEGQAIEVAPGVLWMRLPLPTALDHVNVYALDDGDGWTIVDTGMASKRGVAIWESLLAGPLGGKPVARVIVTHHHPDHVGMAGWFQGRGAELLMTRTARGCSSGAPRLHHDDDATTSRHPSRGRCRH